MNIIDKKLKLALYCLLVLVIFLASTNPGSVASIFLVVPFVLIFLIIWFGLFVSADRWQSFSGKIRLATLGAAMPTLLLVMQSLGQLTVRDTLTVMLLLGVGYFYALRAFNPSSR